jgi:large subunit ribosomal protein L25
MMENLITIDSEARIETGKKTNKNLRKQGKIPAIIYGGRVESFPVTVKLTDIKKILNSDGGENSILRIVQEKKGNVDAMIKDIQYDYLSNSVIHVDFIRIDLNKPVEVSIPIILEGEPIGVKMEDGLLDFVNRELIVKCLPTKIPKEIRVDISNLHVGHSLKVENLPKNEDVKFISLPQSVICAVVAKGKEEEVAKPVEAAPEAGAAAEGVPAAEGAAAAPEEKDKDKDKEKDKDKKGKKEG